MEAILRLIYGARLLCQAYTFCTHTYIRIYSLAVYVKGDEARVNGAGVAVGVVFWVYKRRLCENEVYKVKLCTDKMGVQRSFFIQKVEACVVSAVPYNVAGGVYIHNVGCSGFVCICAPPPI